MYRLDLLGVSGALEARENLGSAVSLLDERAVKKFPRAKNGNCKQSRSVRPLTKRTGIVELYNSIKAAEKTPIGGTLHWTLNTKIATALTTAEFYGCTVVITVDGKGVVIGHYAQETGGTNGCVTMENKAAVKSHILDNLDNEFDLIDFDTTTVAFIVTTASTTSVGYKAIVEHLKEYDI